MMKRPALYVLLFIIIGVAAGQYADSFACIALFMVCSGVLAYALAKIYRCRWLIILAFVTLIAYSICSEAIKTPDKRLDVFCGENIRVSGVVQSVVSAEDEYCFVLNAMVFDTGENNELIDAKTKLRVYAKQAVEIGDMVVLSGRLNQIRGKTNPSDFDFKSYLLARGQFYTFNANNVYIGSKSYGISNFLQHIRDNTCDIYYKIMPESEAGIMCAMILGDTGDIDENISGLYKRTGIYHVIAISGLHITLLGAVLVKLFSRFGRSICSAVVMLLLGGYCVMTGCSVSVLRAVSMFYIMLIGSLIFYDYDIISAAAVSACIFLLFKPLYLFDVGFQLSYGAVFAIGAVGDMMNRFKKYAKLIGAVGVNLAVDLVTKPITMFYFYYINAWSILANIMLVPLMTLVVGMGLLMAVIGFVNINAAELISVPATIIMQSVEAWCGVFTSIPYSHIVTGRPSGFMLIAWFVFLIALYNIIIHSKLKHLTIAAAVFVWLCCVNKVVAQFKAPYITFLDVGQGDSAVGIGNDYCFVVDGGKNGNTLLNYLMYSGVDRVDAVFVSHTDEDHIGGILDIIGEVDIGKIYLPAVFEKNDSYEKLSKLADLCNVRVSVLNENNGIAFNEHEKMECLYPNANIKLSRNNCSMVNRFVCDNGSVLFTGDIEKDAEDILCNDSHSINADVLKLAHHGSDTSNSEAFIEKVNPIIAIASAKKSVYNHPSDAVLDRLEDMEIPCYVTENDGAIKVEFLDDGIRIKAYVEG